MKAALHVGRQTEQKHEGAAKPAGLLRFMSQTQDSEEAKQEKDL